MKQRLTKDLNDLYYEIAKKGKNNSNNLEQLIGYKGFPLVLKEMILKRLLIAIPRGTKGKGDLYNYAPAKGDPADDKKRIAVYKRFRKSLKRYFNIPLDSDDEQEPEGS